MDVISVHLQLTGWDKEKDSVQFSFNIRALHTHTHTQLQNAHTGRLKPKMRQFNEKGNVLVKF